MQTGKPIELSGKLQGGKFPLVCTPLVGRTGDEILSQLEQVLAKKPDVVEWRVDFFQGIGNTADVLGVAADIRRAAGAVPLLFTRRSIREGGEEIPLSEGQVVALYAAVCQSGSVDLVDFEMDNDAAHVRQVREFSRANKVQLILSFHDFHATPALDTLNGRFLRAQQLGADIAKVAVMPQGLEDVLTLLSATLQASRRLTIPVVSMSMGSYGSLTRLFGWTFGSAMTFAIGAGSSAPGQVPMEDFNTVLGILRKSLAGN